MELKITTAPHMEQQDQKAFADELMQRYNSVVGISPEDEVLDRRGLDQLKQVLKKESKAIKVK